MRTSGARNSGVPQKVLVLVPCHMPSLHSPKSATLTYPSRSSKRLSNFKSLGVEEREGRREGGGEGGMKGGGKERREERERS